MNSISNRLGSFVGLCVCLLLAAIVVKSSLAQQPQTRPAPSGAASQPIVAEERQEKASVVEYLVNMPDSKKLGVKERDVTVKLLIGHHYVGRIIYPPGNDWRLYIVDPLFDSRRIEAIQVGVDVGDRGLSYCVNTLLRGQNGPRADFAGIIEQGIESLSADYGVIVKRNADIPGYDKAPMAPDLADVIRPLFKYTPKRERLDKYVHYVVYTYQQIGGQILRHEFVLGFEGPASTTTVRIATGVGDFKGLD